MALFILFMFTPMVADVYPYPPTISSHHIRIEFDLKAHTMEAVDHLKLYKEQRGEITVYINKYINITSVNGAHSKALQYSFKEDDANKKGLIITLPPSLNREIDIEIEYTVKFAEFPADIKFSREFLSDKPVVYIGEEIILLDSSACWHPCLDGPATFNVTATTPAGYEVVMEGTRLSREEENGIITTTWDFPHPASGIYLVGGKYTITEDKYNDIPVYTYFFQEDTNLSNKYIEYSKKYLEMYERLLGRYPFGKFAVVENILPTGFGMPSYTLLGQSVLRLPFIVKTSLGHEIAHNWWGNSVYPDYESGNWSEGLTTYVADYLYDEMDGKGVQYRNQLLRDYTSYVAPSKDYPLTRFKSRTGPEDRSIGYGKGAYVFHMLRVMLGDEVFYNGLRYIIAHRSFRLTSWDDFRIAFEKVSGRDLQWYFRQWVEAAGAPVITLEDVRLKENDKSYNIKAEILQKDKVYEIYLPVLVETEEGPLLSYHWIKKRSNSIDIEVSSRPKSITIDPYYDVFRRLGPEELPPTIGNFMGAKDSIIVLPTKGGQEILGSYFKIASDLDIKTIKHDKEVTEEDFKRASVYIFGGSDENAWTNKLISNLPPQIKIEHETISINGKAYNKEDSVLIVAIANPYNPAASLLLFSGYNPEYINSVGKRIVHYGKYSYLLFVKGENVEKGVWEAEKIGKTLSLY